MKIGKIEIKKKKLFEVCDILIPKYYEMPKFSDVINIDVFFKKIRKTLNKKDLILLDKVLINKDLITVSHDGEKVVNDRIENILEKELLNFYFSTSVVKKILNTKNNPEYSSNKINEKNILNILKRTKKIKAIYKKI